MDGGRRCGGLKRGIRRATYGHLEELRAGPASEKSMRALIAAFVASVVGASTIAHADTWRATVALDPDSPFACRQADVSRLVFDFSDTGSELLGKTANGHDFATPIAADGSVSTIIKVPVGEREFVVELTGNAKSRAFQVFNKEYSCRFRLAPMQ